MKIIILLLVIFILCMVYREHTYYEEGFIYHLCGFIEFCCVVVALCIGMNVSHKQEVQTYGDYKYEIYIPEGRRTYAYYTNKYDIRDNGSISFKDFKGRLVSSPVYSIETNHYYLEKKGID